MRLRGHRVHAESLGSLGCAVGFVWYIMGHMVHWGSPWGRRVIPGSLGLLGCAPGVVEFIRVHWAHRSGIAGLIRVRPVGHRSLG